MITQTGTESELIYRQQAIDALNGELTITGRTNAEAVRGYVKLVKDRLERLPSAPPKKGRWIDGHRMKLDGTFYWYRECDQCGYERNDDNTEKDSNFCPNCGADMRGEEDG